MKPFYFIQLCLCMSIFVLMNSGCSSDSKVKGADGTEYESYQQAVRKMDFEAAYVFLDRIENKKGKDNEKYINARDFIVSHEITYLASLNTKESTKRVLYLLTEIRPESKKIPTGKLDTGEPSDKSSDRKKIDTYSLEVKNYNKQCHSIIDLAIAELNKELAQGVLTCYVPTIIIESSMEKVPFYACLHEIYTIKYSNDDYEQAVSKFNEVNWESQLPEQ